MDEQGLWRLFFQTGAPELWLVIRRLEGMQDQAVADKRDMDENKVVEKTVF